MEGVFQVALKFGFFGIIFGVTFGFIFTITNRIMRRRKERKQ